MYRIRAATYQEMEPYCFQQKAWASCYLISILMEPTCHPSISCSKLIWASGLIKLTYSNKWTFHFQRITNPAKSYKCHLCEIMRKTPQMLLWHLAWRHFKDDILAKNNLDKSSKICPICSNEKSFAQLHNLVIHLAECHDKLQGLVDIKVLMNLKKDIREFKREVPTWLTKKIIHPLSQRLSFNWEYSPTKLASLISYTSNPVNLPLSSTIIDFIEGNWKKMHLRFEP